MPRDIRHAPMYFVVHRSDDQFRIANAVTGVTLSRDVLLTDIHKLDRDRVPELPANFLEFLVEFLKSPKVYRCLFGEAAPYGDGYKTAVTALGAAMTSPNEPSPDSDIPSGYTYFGQFIAHDLTRARAVEGSTRLKNFQSPFLDLDSVYGEGRTQAGQDGRHIRMGETYGGTQYKSLSRDILRDAAGATIPNPRNDDSLLLSQIHVLILAFHNVLADCHPEWTYEQIRRKVIQTVQAIALFDFLPRVVDQNVWERSLRQKGGYWYRQGLDYRGRPDGIPAEAAFAILRFGHSMIRPEYFGWNSNAGAPKYVGTFVATSHLGAAPNSFKDEKVMSDWLPNWASMFECEADGDVLKAKSIDCKLTSFTGSIPDSHLPEGFKEPENLAVRTLMLGVNTALKSGFEIRRELKALGMGQDELNINESNIGASSAEIHSIFLDSKNAELRERPPLWYYVLREAEIARSTGSSSRSQLAGVGAWFLCETIARAVELSSPSVLGPQSEELPIGDGKPESARMSHLIERIGGLDWYALAQRQ